MTEREMAFLSAFSTSYDVAAAAEASGMDSEGARQLLQKEAARAEVDRLVTTRMAGEMLSRIWRMYSEIAFSESPETKAGDRMRALEALRMLASSAGGDDGVPPLTIEYGYV